MAVSPITNLDEYYGLAIYKAKKSYYRLPEAVRNQIELNDLIQESFIGLIKAANKYDPKKGTSFATFCGFFIEGALLDYLRKLDPLTQKERSEVKALDRAEKMLSQSSYAKPSVSELAKALDISEDEVRRIQRLKKTIISIEEIHKPDDKDQNKFAQELPDAENPHPHVEIAKKDLWQDVNACFKNALIHHERDVLTLRNLGELTLKKTAQILKLDIIKVHRVEKKAQAKMKFCLEEKGWSVTDIIEIFSG